MTTESFIGDTSMDRSGTILTLEQADVLFPGCDIALVDCMYREIQNINDEFAINDPTSQ